jgi:hypothetical protein
VIVACLPLIEIPTAACADASVLEAEMLTLLNTCTNAALPANYTRRRTSGLTLLNTCTNAALPANYTRRRTSGIDIPQVADTVIIPVPTFNQPGGLSRRLRGERRLWTTCTTTNPSYMDRLVCCSNPGKYSYCGSLTNHARRRELCDEGCGPAAAQVEAILPEITLACTTAYATFALSHPGCFAETGDESSLDYAAIIMTGGTA